MCKPTILPPELFRINFLLGICILYRTIHCAEIIDPATCISYPCQIFYDDFEFLDHNAWAHEINLAGGGSNGEFEAYVNNRSVSYTRDGVLYIKPQLTSDWKTEDFLYEGDLDLWGMNGRNGLCTGPISNGCRRFGIQDDGEIINPILSARIRTLGSFGFTYGRVEARAKLPKGSWLWPAIWLKPDGLHYGDWPASGEIDLVESRGNEIYGSQSNAYAGSTLHWGPFSQLNSYRLTHSDYSLPNGEVFPDNFHTWTFDWTPENMTWFLDGTQVLFVDPGNSFWDFGNFSQEGIDNPWQERGKMAPFDSDFYLTINLAVGGTSGYFSDSIESVPPKPWVNSSPTPMKDFWEGKLLWLPTWEQGEGKISENAALQVDYISVYKLSPD